MPVIQQSSRASAPSRTAPPQTRQSSPGQQGLKPPSAAQPARKAAVARIAGAKKIRNKELPAFSRQLSAMLLAGMPVLQALDALEDQASNKNFKSVIVGLKNALQEGASFSEALGRYPQVFDTLYVNMIRAGESGGQLGETEARLASFLEASAKLARKVKSAMSYPVIVLCIALGIAVAMILFIVPVFADMFADFKAELPGPTQFMINLSHMLKSYGIFVAIGLIAVVIAFRKWKSTPSGGLAFARFVLKSPVFGELSQKVAASRFSRTFAQLLSSGVPILKAMEIVAGATGNKVFESVIMEARGAVERGEPLSSTLVRYNCMPKLLVHMLAAGEKTGKIDEMLQSIADFYDDEVETMLDGLTALLEPLLMVFLGVVIGGIVISMFMPIFKMGEIVGKG